MGVGVGREVFRVESESKGERVEGKRSREIRVLRESL